MSSIRNSKKLKNAIKYCKELLSKNETKDVTIKLEKMLHFNTEDFSTVITLEEFNNIIIKSRFLKQLNQLIDETIIKSDIDPITIRQLECVLVGGTSKIKIIQSSILEHLIKRYNIYYKELNLSLLEREEMNNNNMKNTITIISTKSNNSTKNINEKEYNNSNDYKYDCVSEGCSIYSIIKQRKLNINIRDKFSGIIIDSSDNEKNENEREIEESINEIQMEITYNLNPLIDCLSNKPCYNQFVYYKYYIELFILLHKHHLKYRNIFKFIKIEIKEFIKLLQVYILL